MCSIYIILEFIIEKYFIMYKIYLHILICIYIYIYSFFVSLWFQEKITWSPNWWQTMILRCWLLWWLWHHPWHHADATSGSFWDKAGMGGWEYGQAVVWTKNTPKKIAHGAGCSGFLKNNFQLFVLFGESLWSLPWIPIRSMDSYNFTTFLKWTTNTTTPENWRFGIPQ